MFSISNKYSLSLRFFSLFLSWVLISAPGLACPCGCGSHSPLELTEVDQYKYRLSSSREFAPKAYRASGQASSDAIGLLSTDTIEVSGVYALSTYLATSLQLGIKRNTGDKNSKYGLSDPTLGLAWSFYEKNFSTIEMRLKSTLSLKAPLASSDLSDELSSFSNGHWEGAMGMQALFSYFNWTCIVGDKVILRDSRGSLEPGLINKLSLSLAYTFIGQGQVMVGTEQELRRPDAESGVRSGETFGRYGHNFLWSLQKRVGDRKNLELAGSHPLPVQKNSIAYHNVSLSFSQTV